MPPFRWPPSSAPTTPFVTSPLPKACPWLTQNSPHLGLAADRLLVLATSRMAWVAWPVGEMVRAGRVGWAPYGQSKAHLALTRSRGLLLDPLHLRGPVGQLEMVAVREGV